MVRLFTALEIPGDVANKLASLRGGTPGARWMEPENYHITLRFIGDVENRMAEGLAEELAKVIHPPFPGLLNDLSFFGGAQPRMIVALAKPDQGLAALQKAHERIARSLGLAPETRKFAPHVTLARLGYSDRKKIAEYLEARGAIRLSFEAKRFVLYSSRSSVGGGPYLLEAAYPLEGHARPP